MMQQQKINWEREQQRGKIDRIAPLLSSGELRLLRAIHHELLEQRRSADQIPLGVLLNATGYARSRFYDLKRSLEAREVILTRRPEGAWHGDGVEYQIDWETIERLGFAGDGEIGRSGDRESRPEPALIAVSALPITPSPNPPIPPAQGCPMGVRWVSDGCPISDEPPPPHTIPPPKDKETPPPLCANPQPPTPRSEREEEEWRDLKRRLTEEGNLAAAASAIAEARANGCQPADVGPLLDEFAWKYPGRWSPGELWHRVRSQMPGLDPTKGWGKGDLRAVERYRSQAKELRRALEGMTEERFADVCRQYLGTPHGRDSPSIGRIIERRIITLNREAALATT